VAGTIYVYTVGHSNHPAETFFGLLERNGIRALADVRAIPGSRRHPQFGRAALEAACRERRVAYHWMPGLGGRRRSALASSPHVAWEVAAFRAYADYMDTPEFTAALGELEAIAATAATAFMCAEALWWQCHRRLIADRLVAGGWSVLHVDARGGTSAHALPDFARVVDGRIVYDVGATPSLLRSD
jgi:uncharacterized protein (DUF488 family)